MFHLARLPVAAMLDCFRWRHPVSYTNAAGIQCQAIINSLEHEDGSGWSYNLTLNNGQQIYIRYHTNTLPDRVTVHGQPNGRSVTHLCRTR